MKKVSLYDPYLDVVGGGEKHILSILKVFDEKDYQIDVFWDTDLRKKINKRFNLSFNNLNFIPNIFNSKKISVFEKNRRLKKYSHFFYVTDGSYFLSGAKNNYVFAMVPKRELYSLDLINKMKLYNFNFIANSKFTQGALNKWGIKSEVIYPFIDNELAENNKEIKEKIILTVGRFFPQLHSKQHKQIVQSFNRLSINDEFKDFRLILVGGLKEEDRRYLEEFKRTIGDNKKIQIKINIDHKELVDLYKKSMYYWHFTGYGLDDKKQPGLVEHLGISPLEAMAASSIVFCYNAGGPKEFIDDGLNGFLFNNEEDLINKMKKISENIDMQNKIREKARESIGKTFTKKVFTEKVKNYFKI